MDPQIHSVLLQNHHQRPNPNANIQFLPGLPPHLLRSLYTPAIRLDSPPTQKRTEGFLNLLHPRLTSFNEIPLSNTHARPQLPSTTHSSAMESLPLLPHCLRQESTPHR